MPVESDLWCVVFSRDKQGEWALFPDGYKNIVSYAKIDVDRFSNPCRMNTSKRTTEQDEMSERQAYLLQQCYSFQAGFQDCRGGENFDSRKNSEWQRGWKWANLNRK